jgi:thiamine-phosphate pyrophosphorylase
MSRSDAEILWDVACVLARDAADVSRPAGRIGPDLPPLLFFTDPDRTPRPWETASRLPAGSGVVFRHFGRSDAHRTALRLRQVTQHRKVRLLIGQDPDLAEAVAADGIHLPERALGLAAGLRAAHPDWLITGAAHSAAALTATNVDALVISPVFPAGGPSRGRPALGLPGLRALIEQASCPVHALGGIDAALAPDLIGSGACGLAGVSAIQTAYGPP